MEIWYHRLKQYINYAANHLNKQEKFKAVLLVFDVDPY